MKIRFRVKLEKEREERVSVKKSELLRAIRQEILRHDLDTFMNAQHKIVETGCPTCKKRINTMTQFLDHLTNDVMPAYSRVPTDVLALN